MQGIPLILAKNLIVGLVFAVREPYNI